MQISNLAARIGAAERHTFRAQGFLIVERLLANDLIERLRLRFPVLFSGVFETGVYPDEWYWRKGMSLPDVTRHMSNAWKADLEIARLALSADLAAAAGTLAEWPGVRLGQDTIWWKPPGAKAIAYHQDSSFTDFLDPAETVTCWISLDDTRRDAGTIEYLPGSHRWPLTALPAAFHASDDYRAQARAAAEAAGIAPPDPFMVEVPAGSCVFHSGQVWHGSGKNGCADVMRRAIGLHFIREDTTFSDRPGGYIYRRYQKAGDSRMDESFFPIIWNRAGYRTPWIERYCRDGRR